MGGNALKVAKTRRYQKDEFFALSENVLKRLNSIFPDRKMGLLKAYSDKESFGDMDVLMDAVNLPENWREMIKDSFLPLETYEHPNSPVLTFDHKECQIDVVTTPFFDFSMGYYSFNDLGNLMGRVVHSMGMSMGHEALYFRLIDGTESYGKVALTPNFEEALEFFEFDLKKFKEGFKSLDEIFNFVISNPYFDPWFFQLENRSYKERIRDKKRPTYNKFLEYVDLHKFPAGPKAECLWKDYVAVNPNEKAPLDLLKTSKKLKEAWEKWPLAKETMDKLEKSYRDDKVFRQRFYGEMVQEWTGLEGKVLGDLIKSFKDTEDFRKLVLETPEQIKSYVMLKFEVFRSNQF